MLTGEACSDRTESCLPISHHVRQSTRASTAEQQKVVPIAANRASNFPENLSPSDAGDLRIDTRFEKDRDSYVTTQRFADRSRDFQDF